VTGDEPVTPGTGDGPLRRRDRHRSALAGFRAALRPTVAVIDARWEQVGLTEDPEHLHDLRVALRRTRTIVAAGRRVLPRAVRDDLTSELAWFARATGRPRDLDVHVEALLGIRERLDAPSAIDPVIDRIQAERADAHAKLVTLQGEERAGTLRAALGGWCAVPDGWVRGGRDADRPVGEVAAIRIGNAHLRVREGLTRARQAGEDEALHRLRRDVKRLRYLLEAFGGLGGRGHQRSVLWHLRALQDVLGEHQDTVVQRCQLADLALPRAGSEEGAGELVMLHRAAEEQHHAAHAAAQTAVALALTSPLHARIEELTARAADVRAGRRR
jgi:CHAD domain-containing protein